jgi:hypothetical protein
LPPKRLRRMRACRDNLDALHLDTPVNQGLHSFVQSPRVRQP